MKTIFEYDENTGWITDKNGLMIMMLGMKGFEPEKETPPVLEMIKQGVTPDELIKLKNNDLL